MPQILQILIHLHLLFSVNLMPYSELMKGKSVITFLLVTGDCWSVFMVSSV